MPKPEVLVRPLLNWFNRYARDLPWRRTTDPYAIWISEIMLQQTQVKTVIPYWERWMTAFPNVQILADAELTPILKLWEGLGYYTRARNLHQAAKVISTKYEGAFPRSYDQILDLPGIGRYTAGAICSIAFNQPTPILDGNVVRVLTRIFGIQENAKDKLIQAQLWDLAGKLVSIAAKERSPSHQNCSHLNQALMELGATICTPKQPQCSQCPTGQHCTAFKENRTQELPNLGPRKAATQRRFFAFVVRNKESYLIHQRPGKVVNAHLWEFPNLEIFESLVSLPTLAHQCLGFTPDSLHPLTQIKHSITRYRITLEVYHTALSGRIPPKANDWHWCTYQELEQLAFPSAHRKIVKSLKECRTLQLSMQIE